MVRKLESVIPEKVAGLTSVSLRLKAFKEFFENKKILKKFKKYKIKVDQKFLKIFIRKIFIRKKDLSLDLSECTDEPWEIQHEFMHALGFWHEMQRGDASKYCVRTFIQKT